MWIIVVLLIIFQLLICVQASIVSVKKLPITMCGEINEHLIIFDKEEDIAAYESLDNFSGDGYHAITAYAHVLDFNNSKTHEIPLPLVILNDRKYYEILLNDYFLIASENGIIN